MPGPCSRPHLVSVLWQLPLEHLGAALLLEVRPAAGSGTQAGQDRSGQGGPWVQARFSAEESNSQRSTSPVLGTHDPPARAGGGGGGVHASQARPGLLTRGPSWLPAPSRGRAAAQSPPQPAAPQSRRRRCAAEGGRVGRARVGNAHTLAVASCVMMDKVYPAPCLIHGVFAHSPAPSSPPPPHNHQARQCMMHTRPAPHGPLP